MYNVTVDLVYLEPGMNFSGRINWIDGEVVSCIYRGNYYAGLYEYAHDIWLSDLEDEAEMGIEGSFEDFLTHYSGNVAVSIDDRKYAENIFNEQRMLY